MRSLTRRESIAGLAAAGIAAISYGATLYSDRLSQREAQRTSQEIQVYGKLLRRYGAAYASDESLRAASIQVLELIKTLGTVPCVSRPEVHWTGALQNNFPGSPEIANTIAFVKQTVTRPGGGDIEQYFCDDVDEQVARIDCRNGDLIILYNPYALLRLSNDEREFVRQHELGHIANGDFRCAPIRTVNRPRYTEGQADCWAFADLSTSNHGHSVIGAGKSLLRRTPDDPTRNNEGSYERYRILERGCRPPPPDAT